MKSSLFQLGVKSIAAAGILLVLSGQAQAQYVPNFDTFTGNYSLSGQDAWVTNDTNQANYVGTVVGYSASSSDYWAAIGGSVQVAPSGTDMLLYRPFNAMDSATFSAVFAISSPGRLTKDSFGWQFQNAAGADIASVDFVYFNDTTLKIKWTDYAGNQEATSYGIGYDAAYTISASVLNLGTGAPQFQVSLTDGNNITTTPINLTLSASTPTGIAQVAAEWVLAGTPAAYGDNTMYFSNYSVVPEPSAVAIVGLAVLSFVFVARLRRKKMSAAKI